MNTYSLSYSLSFRGEVVLGSNDSKNNLSRGHQPGGLNSEEQQSGASRMFWSYSGTAQLNRRESKEEDSRRINQNLVRENPSVTLPPEEAGGAWNTDHGWTESWDLLGDYGVMENPDVPQCARLCRGGASNTKYKHWQQDDCRFTMIQQWLFFPCGTERRNKRGFGLPIHTSNIFTDTWGCLTRGRIRCDQNAQYISPSGKTKRAVGS